MLDEIFTDINSAKGFSVNYIWLCPRDEEPEDCETKLPLHYFERVYDNAKRYPEATINVWLDFKHLNAFDRFYLDSHRYFFDALNINLCDLRDIPDYKNSPGFDKDSNIAIYARADFARVLVLRSEMQKEENKYVVYSDLDCEDVKLQDGKVRECLDDYGFVFGHAGKNRSCNGFIGLAVQKAENFMESYLFPRTLKAFQKNLTNHFGAFAKAVGGYRNKYFPGVNRGIWGLVELPFMRTQMPYNPDIYEGVCAPRPTRVPGSKELV